MWPTIIDIDKLSIDIDNDIVDIIDNPTKTPPLLLSPTFSYFNTTTVAIMPESILSTESTPTSSTKGRQRRAVATWDHSRPPKPDEPKYVKKSLV